MLHFMLQLIRYECLHLKNGIRDNPVDFIQHSSIIFLQTDLRLPGIHPIGNKIIQLSVQFIPGLIDAVEQFWEKDGQLIAPGGTVVLKMIQFCNLQFQIFFQFFGSSAVAENLILGSNTVSNFMKFLFNRTDIRQNQKISSALCNRRPECLFKITKITVPVKHLTPCFQITEFLRTGNRNDFHIGLGNGECIRDFLPVVLQNHMIFCIQVDHGKGINNTLTVLISSFQKCKFGFCHGRTGRSGKYQ